MSKFGKVRVPAWLALLRVARKQLRWRFRYNTAAMGNAFQVLHAFVQPRQQHAVVQMLEEQVDLDEEGAEDFLRQARRLQRGEDVGVLRVGWAGRR